MHVSEDQAVIFSRQRLVLVLGVTDKSRMVKLFKRAANVLYKNFVNEYVDAASSQFNHHSRWIKLFGRSAAQPLASNHGS